MLVPLATFGWPKAASVLRSIVCSSCAVDVFPPSLPVRALPVLNFSTLSSCPFKIAPVAVKIAFENFTVTKSPSVSV